MTATAITGLGVDLVDVRRIAGIWERFGERFLLRIFAPSELATIEGREVTATFLAGRWAAKEAVSKSLGTGFRGFNMCDIAVMTDAQGRPEVILHGGAALQAQKVGVARILLSISHEKEMATATAIALAG